MTDLDTDTPDEPELSEHEQAFARFVDAMDLDVDPAGMDEEERRSFENEKRIVMRAMKRGNLTVDEEGRPVYAPQVGGGEPLVWREPDGAALMEMDRAKTGKNVKASYLVMGAITKQPAKRFATMMQRDLKVCTALFNLFMGG